jgi:hypothetical protein
VFIGTKETKSGWLVFRHLGLTITSAVLVANKKQLSLTTMQPLNFIPHNKILVNFKEENLMSNNTNKVNTNPMKVITGPDTRWSYANVWEAKSINGGTPKFSVSLIIPKSDTRTIAKIKAAIEAAYREGEAKLKGNGKAVPPLSAIKTPLRDGDTERPDDPAYANSYFINANSSTAPGIVDADRQPILERSEVYSGVYGRASINFYAFNSNGNRGIACGLNNLQKIRDGEPLGGKSRAEDDFRNRGSTRTSCREGKANNSRGGKDRSLCGHKADIRGSGDLLVCGFGKIGHLPLCESPDFEILLFGYSVDGGAVQVVDFTAGEQLPPEVLTALIDDTVFKWAFNAQFERICLSKWLGLPVGQYLDPKSWRCTMVWSAYMGLPLSLEGTGAVLGLEKQKLTEGKDLIRYFCQPCKPTAANGGRTRNLPKHALDKWERFKAYNRHDVESEMALQEKLAKFPVPEEVWEEYHLDQEINDRGVALDMALVRQAIDMDKRSRSELTAHDTGTDQTRESKFCGSVEAVAFRPWP